MTESEMETSTGVALDVWDIVAVVIYFGLIMGVGLMVSFYTFPFKLEKSLSGLYGIFHVRKST